jgi:hypothetical protein
MSERTRRHILVVGNFDLDNHEEATFGSRAWKAIGQVASSDMPDLAELTPLWRDLGKFGEWLETRNEVQERYSSPIPIPISDQIWSLPKTDFAEALFAFLRRINCLAIISASPAEETRILLECLGPIRIPVLITVATAVGILEEDDRSEAEFRHVLRLIPSNSQQAQAIRLRAEQLVAEYKGQIFLFFDDPTDSYVADLKNQVLSTLKGHHIRVCSDVQLLTEVATERDLVISIGYSKTLKSLSSVNCNILQSDGVTLEELSETVRTTAAPTAGSSDGSLASRIRLCRPAHEHQAYAQWAYRAVDKASQEAWRELAKSCQLRTRLHAPVYRIRDVLEREDRNCFYFAGNENQAGGYYVVEPPRADYESAITTGK